MCDCKGPLWLLMIALAVCNVYSFPSGPPLGGVNFDNVCNALRPNPTSSHGSGTAENGGYTLEISPPMTPVTNGFTYQVDTTYTIRIVGGTIQGFLVQARLPGNNPQLGMNPMLLGSFQPGTGHQIYDCDELTGAVSEATITHSVRQNAIAVQFTWTSPMNAGDVEFYYTVVQALTTHFDAISASQVGVEFSTVPPPTTAGPTVATTIPPQTTAPPGNTVAPVRAPEDYRLQILNPDGCSRASCDLFIGIDTNTGDDGFLDIYMEGTAEGWVAVGFSETPNMFSADVVSCNRQGDTVVAIDGWNQASPARASNTDSIQDVTLFSSSFNATTNRLSCTVSKRIAPSGTGEDLDLNNNLFVIFARRVTASTQLTNLESHAGDGTAVRGASATQLAIATGTTGTTQPQTTAPPRNTVAPVRAPEDYRLRILNPDGCSRASCDLFIGIDTNTGDDGFLDIYMEGTAEGWVAVGFSETPNMFSADVVSCNRQGDTIVAIDGWNPVGRASDRDSIQDVTLFSSFFDANTNRLSCTVSKRIAPSGTGEDLDLNNDLFLIFARRVPASTQLTNLETHADGGSTAVRGASANQLAIATGTTGTTQPQTTAPPGNTAAPDRDPEDYRLQILSPTSCSRASCDLFIGIDTNTGDDGFLDIYMEGTAEGWVAVGFSETPNMFSADVVSCNRQEDTIEAIDGWNRAAQARASDRDFIQDVTLFSSFFDANTTRLSCTVSKRIAPSGIGEDLDLNNNLFLIFARRVTASTQLTNLDSHADGSGSAVRGASANQFVISTGEGTVGGNVFRPKLIRAHGILMIIAWPLLAVTAIFFALFMRPALPNGEWFQVHRALLLCSLFIGAVAFILIFIALANTRGLVDVTSNTSLTHLILGVIIMALQIINPIISIFRCHPGTKNRWIFNLLHGSVIGLLAEILALINVAIGVYIFSANLSQFRSTRSPFWVFLSWDIFYILLVVILFVLFTVIATSRKMKGLAPSAVQALFPANESQKKAEPVGINLDSAVGDKPQEKSAPERKTPSQDAPLRWAALIVYLGVTVPILLAVIIMVALPQ